MFFIIAGAFVLLSVVATLYKQNVISGTLMKPLVVLLVGGVIASFTVSVVPAGHVGVVDLFGKVSETTLKPGLNFKNPFARVVNLSTKTQEHLQKARVPSKEGLLVHLELSILFHLDPEKAASIYEHYLGLS